MSSPKSLVSNQRFSSWTVRRRKRNHRLRMSQSSLFFQRLLPTNFCRNSVNKIKRTIDHFYWGAPQVPPILPPDSPHDCSTCLRILFCHRPLQLKNNIDRNHLTPAQPHYLSSHLKRTSADWTVPMTGRSIPLRVWQSPLVPTN